MLTTPVFSTYITAVPLTLHPEPVATEMTSTWPDKTDLCFPPGGTKVMLTIQRLLVRAIIQDSIEILRASLMFENAYPDSVQSLVFVWRALVTAAQRRLPATLSIHNRLLQDNEYISKIAPLV